ncbi:MAG: DNA (cytosine-5-)-methyltransferase [Tagaea sp.]|nr:DNA (cytosine-5-)-methyltransferase [Tagaea sp.]
MLVSLFSGIGGFERGLGEAGFETAAFCDIDPAARAVLGARFPETPIWEDITAVRRLPPETRLLTAGFPCQNLSMAGNKAGIRGSQSALIDDVFRLLKRKRVPTILVENVYFMLHLDKGRAMEHIVGGFEALGYNWAYRVVDTYWFGIPQRRRRVFFVASTEIDPRRVLFADDAGQLDHHKPQESLPTGFYWTEGSSGIGLTRDAIPPLKAGSGLGIPSTPALLLTDGRIVVPSIAAAERLQGFPQGWTRAANAEFARRRLALIGNAVSVPVAKWLGKRLMQPGDFAELGFAKLAPGSPWPSAAWGVGTARYRATSSTRPISHKSISIQDYAPENWPELSLRAASGFLSRAEASSLRIPRWFLNRVRAYVRKTAKLSTGPKPIR